jgi:predicted ribosome quality control (RQC) complex YloA/Tae2 family protein
LDPGFAATFGLNLLAGSTYFIMKAQFMKPLSHLEVIKIANDLQTLVGAQFQECLQNETQIALGFYMQQRLVWLLIDLNPLRPVIVRRHGPVPLKKKITRPLSLFIRSRFLGRRVASVQADELAGRVLRIAFHRAKEEERSDLPVLELRLFAHGQNLIAIDGKAQVAEKKPKDLVPSIMLPTDLQTQSRSWQEIETEYGAELAALRSPAATIIAAGKGETDCDAGPVKAQTKVLGATVSATDSATERAVAKKKKALEKMREDLSHKTSGVYRLVGDWIKTHMSLEVPDEWRECIDVKRSVTENIELAFSRAKDNERKIEGARARIVLLESELKSLLRQDQSQSQDPDLAANSTAHSVHSAAKSSHSKNTKKGNQNANGGKPTAAEGANSLLARAAAKGRRHKIADDLDVYIGKSAADNLAILRRAQSFDYWLHLRDQPGSHAILRRARGRLVKDVEFIEAGKWVVEQSLGRRSLDLQGERHDLLIVECRFVRPIKGDRLGRVNYSNERVITLRF